MGKFLKGDFLILQKNYVVFVGVYIQRTSHFNLRKEVLDDLRQLSTRFKTPEAYLHHQHVVNDWIDSCL